MADVWVYRNGDRVIHRGPLEECAARWAAATGLDKWHGSVAYESGRLTLDQQADRLAGLMAFMDDPQSGWREPPDFTPMREAMAAMGRSAAESVDRIFIGAFRWGRQ